MITSIQPIYTQMLTGVCLAYLPTYSCLCNKSDYFFAVCVVMFQKSAVIKAILLAISTLFRESL